MDRFKRDYPWTQQPLVACGPMRLIALASLATQVSLAGGLGFVGAGNDVSDLDSILHESASLLSHPTTSTSPLPVGVGFLLWAGDTLLTSALPILTVHRPAAVWLFAPRSPSQLPQWTSAIHAATPQTKIWIQIGTVADALDALRSSAPDVLVVQGQDAGGHGLRHAAGLVALVPEVRDAVERVCAEEGRQVPGLIAAGGISDGRGAAAALALGADGAVLGTKYLAAPEANIADGYRSAVLAAGDGGVTTERGTLYDRLRGTTDWPERYGGRGVLNESWLDDEKGLEFEENKRQYDEALEKGDEGWGEGGRLTTYAGAGVGLVNKVQSAAEITESIRSEAKAVLKAASRRVE